MDNDYKSEDGQMWAQILEDGRRKRAAVRSEAKELVDVWAEGKPLKVDHYASYAIRVSSEAAKLKMDVFPASKAYHDIVKNLRGTYKDLIPFLTKHFKL